MYFLTEVGCNIPYKIMSLIVTVINLIKFAVPIMLIIIGMLDLGKAVVASKEDEIKKAQTTLIKRAIAAVLVFFIISIVTWLMSIIPQNDENKSSCLPCLHGAKKCEYTEGAVSDILEGDKRIQRNGSYKVIK